ncbi:hypothetical protein ON010_g2470 [Phytophthora cinnamomi]|nr:hypothetical protein ON010_g2470 [Phytophthora cinnamomi]
MADILEVARSGEELAVLVERARHDTVRRVEGLLHTVAVVDVNIDVQDALVSLEQLQDAEHAVVHVAEAGGLRALAVVQATGVVDDDVSRSGIQFGGATDGSRRVELAELEEAVKDRAVLAHVEALQLAQILVHVVGRHKPQEVDVVVRVEARELRPVHEAGALSAEQRHPTNSNNTKSTATMGLVKAMHQQRQRCRSAVAVVRRLPCAW